MTQSLRWTGGLALLVGATLAGTAQQPPKPKPRPGAGLPPGVKALRGLAYIADGNERHQLDLYLPEQGWDPRPVIVWVHGGAWRAGSKDNCPAVPFAACGYAVASINYRLSRQAV